MITHPEKPLFPDDGITKGDLVAYYEAVAPLMLPHIQARPVTLERYPSGIEKKGFWQKNAPKGAPDWLEQVAVPKKDGRILHPLISDRRALLWAANLNTVTFHVSGCRAPELYRPDLCVVDLDPSEGEPEGLRAAALGVRDLLRELGLSSWIKTTGSKGFHIVSPLDNSAEVGEVWRLADAVGRILVERHPESLTREFHKADRSGRILVDTGRNGFGATFAAPYSVRARRGAPVSAPCTWDEVERGSVHPRSFDLRNMSDRIAAVGDPWTDLHRSPHAAREALERLPRAAGESRSSRW